jgi:hypothetical protein
LKYSIIQIKSPLTFSWKWIICELRHIFKIIKKNAV